MQTDAMLCVRLLCMLALRALDLLFVPLLCVSALCAFVPGRVRRPRPAGRACRRRRRGCSGPEPGAFRGGRRHAAAPGRRRPTAGRRGHGRGAADSAWCTCCCARLCARADTHNRSPSPRFPYTAPFPVRSFSPPKPFLCMQHPTRMPHVCLDACIVTLPEALVFEKVPS